MPARATSVVTKPSAESKEIKHPIRFMLDNGFIFKLNQTFFHPTGFIMTIRDTGNPNEDFQLRLLDNRKNPTTTFDPDTFRSGMNKWDNFWGRAGAKIHQLRKRLLDITVQQKPDYREQLGR